MSQIVIFRFFSGRFPNSTRVSVFVGTTVLRYRFLPGMMRSNGIKQNQPRYEKIRRGEATEPQRCLQRFERKGLPLYSCSGDGVFRPSILF